MVTRIKKWGNSQGLRITLQQLAAAGMEVGDEVDVAVHDGTLVITPARRVRGGRDLRRLVSRIPADYQPGEVDWGAPAGDETW